MQPWSQRRKTYFCFYCVTSRDVMYVVSDDLARKTAKQEIPSHHTTFNTELKAFNQKLFTNVPYYISIFPAYLTNSIIISLSAFSAFVTNQDHTIWISSTFFLTL